MITRGLGGGSELVILSAVLNGLPPKRTHDSIGCAGGWGVSCTDERRSACAAAVEAGHGGKTAVDVWRHGVCGVTLQWWKKKNPEIIFPALFDFAGVCARIKRLIYSSCANILQ